MKCNLRFYVCPWINNELYEPVFIEPEGDSKLRNSFKYNETNTAVPKFDFVDRRKINISVTCGIKEIAVYCFPGPFNGLYLTDRSKLFKLTSKIETINKQLTTKC